MVIPNFQTPELCKKNITSKNNFFSNFPNERNRIFVLGCFFLLTNFNFLTSHLKYGGLRIAILNNLGHLTRNILCWFKLSGQNELNFNFQTRFAPIGLRIDKKRREQKLLRILLELLWCFFFSEILNQKNYQELRWNYSVKWWEMFFTRRFYTAQESSTRVKSPKTCLTENIFAW